MLNGRLYRAAFTPFFLALAVAAFSLSASPRALTSTLAPDAFDGARAFAQLKSLALDFPSRRPGSRGEERLAGYVRQTLEGLGGTAGGGFTVRTRTLTAQTIDGERTLTTVIAQRPGSTNAMPIVILAHRDAAGPGRARAELSGTAALLELARVFAARETKRTIILVSTSGGSGGGAGAADFASHARGPFDAAIVLGNLAGVHERKPLVVPYSDGFGSAPLRLQRTVASAITQETGSDPGAPSVAGQLAHLAFGATVGEQGPLDAAGVPAVLVQASGEGPARVREAVSAGRLQGLGRAVLSAVDALDGGPDLPSGLQTGVVVQHQTIPAWALRLLVGTLLLPPLIVVADGLARLRRRRGPIGRSVRRFALWTLACSLPFVATAIFARLLGVLQIIGATPSEPVSPQALPLDAAATRAVLAVALVLAVAWLAWPRLLGRWGLPVLPEADAAGLALGLVLLVLALIVWMLNPFAALLLLPAVHLWLLLASPELRPRPPLALGVVALALLPLALLIAFYARHLSMGPGALAWGAVSLLAGGHLGIAPAILWSLCFGCAVGAILLALAPPSEPARPGSEDHIEVTIRGPLSYAGPGSLGGTESALRR